MHRAKRIGFLITMNPNTHDRQPYRHSDESPRRLLNTYALASESWLLLARGCTDVIRIIP
jgi:hypothetical protein